MDKECIEDVESGTPEKKKKGIPGLVAFLICLLIAFVIWCYAKGGAIKEQMEEEGNGNQETESTVTESET